MNVRAERARVPLLGVLGVLLGAGQMFLLGRLFLERAFANYLGHYLGFFLWGFAGIYTTTMIAFIERRLIRKVDPEYRPLGTSLVATTLGVNALWDAWLIWAFVSLWILGIDPVLSTYPVQ